MNQALLADAFTAVVLNIFWGQTAGYGIGIAAGFIRQLPKSSLF
jgi:hypothetical protein